MVLEKVSVIYRCPLCIGYYIKGNYRGQKAGTSPTPVQAVHIWLTTHPPPASPVRMDTRLHYLKHCNL